MRHQQNTKKFKRTEEERKRLWKDLVTALIKNETILTFTARAKWFRPKFDRLVTLVKSANGDTKAAFNKVRPFLPESVARKLIEDIVPRFEGRTGGYTSIVKVFQEFSQHDKSIVKLVDGVAAPKKEVKAVETTTTEEVAVEPKAKKPAAKKTTKTTAKKTTKK